MKLVLEDAILQHEGSPPLLEGVNLTVEDGDFVVLEGRSGCGKSSFLRLLNRLDALAGGRYRVDGKEVDEWPVPVLRRRIGFLQQRPVMIEGTVRENLLLGFAFEAARNDPRPDDARLGEWLERLDLAGVELEARARQLSVGQQQRVALARVLLLEPEVLLADEPTSALDPESRTQVVEALERANVEGGVGVVLVAHDELAFRRAQARRIRFTDSRGLEEVPA